MKVVCYVSPDNPRRSAVVAEAMRAGMARQGHSVSQAGRFDGVQADLAIAYGWNRADVFAAYKTAGARFLYVDLGFWKRKGVGWKFEGYHKVCLDDWSPAARMRRNCPSDRFSSLGVEVKPWRKAGDSVIVAGMSARSAAHHGLGAEEWEGRAIAALLQSGIGKKIVYRPKPSWIEAKPLAGAEFAGADKELAPLLDRAHLLVTHHSSAAIDAICAGVPVACEKGVGALISTALIGDPHNPALPSDAQRQSLLNDIAYMQWTPAEMRSGRCWDHYRSLL